MPVGHGGCVCTGCGRWLRAWLAGGASDVAAGGGTRADNEAWLPPRSAALGTAAALRAVATGRPRSQSGCIGDVAAAASLALQSPAGFNAMDVGGDCNLKDTVAGVKMMDDGGDCNLKDTCEGIGVTGDADHGAATGRPA